MKYSRKQISRIDINEQNSSNDQNNWFLEVIHKIPDISLKVFKF